MIPQKHINFRIQRFFLSESLSKKRFCVIIARMSLNRSTGRSPPKSMSIRPANWVLIVIRLLQSCGRWCRLQGRHGDGVVQLATEGRNAEKPWGKQLLPQLGPKPELFYFQASIFLAFHVREHPIQNN